MRSRAGLGVASLLFVLLAAAIAVPRFLPHPPPARPLPALALTGPGDRPVTLADFRGRWVLVYFGYTHCPGSCATPLDAMARAAAALGGRTDVVALFVTVDPGRDSRAVLDRFAQPYAPPVVALRGDAAATEAAERSFGVYVAQRETGGGPEIDHGNAITVIDPAGRIAGRVDAGAPPGVIAAAIGRPAS